MGQYDIYLAVYISANAEKYFLFFANFCITLAA